MYHSLTGTLIEKTPVSAVVEAGGVGYYVVISVATYTELPPVGQNVRLLTHFLVREDAHALFGFYAAEERDLFRQLISISGIGPKVAMSALSGIPLEVLKKAIVDGALEVLTSIAGIGRKTAERIIVELREKIVLERREAQGPASPALKGGEQVVEDSLQALLALGYSRPEAKTAIQKALKEENLPRSSAEDLIRASLKNL